jgi:ribonucleoside-diphosphate reductase alpha chain
VNPFDHPERFAEVVATAMRMLDNVIDINFYPSDRAEASNLAHRPVGLGLMGMTDLMAQKGIDWESEACLQFNDELMEGLSYWAIHASVGLAIQRGAYSTFGGSKWSQGILPIDTARDQTTSGKYDWNYLRVAMKAYGMRNCNTMAIAPTATISNIIGVTPCIEPNFELHFSKKNMGGKFLVLAPSLRYAAPGYTVKTCFDIDPDWIVDAAARRQKWIDQAQSTNIWIKAGTKGKRLSDIYISAWKKGLKTTYYLRSQSAEDAQKAPEAAPAAPVTDVMEQDVSAGLCSIENPDCTSCQ